jgi:hypothetical protein
MQRWRCEYKACHNHGLTCFVLNQRHYPMNSNNVKAWNAAIYNGDATVNNPPLSLRVFVHEKPQRKGSANRPKCILQTPKTPSLQETCATHRISTFICQTANQTNGPSPTSHRVHRQAPPKQQPHLQSLLLHHPSLILPDSTMLSITLRNILAGISKENPKMPMISLKLYNLYEHSVLIL